jgi:hypothetical protein
MIRAMTLGGLPALKTAGNRIVECETGAAVLLRGVNRSGMEYAPSSWDESEFDLMVRDWGANILRIPFNQERATPRNGRDAEPYLRLLDRIIALAAERGAYTLLALQWLDARTVRGFDTRGEPNFVPPLPDETSLAMWRGLAARYRDESSVLFDLLTEPHTPLSGDPLQNEIPRVTMREWQPWAETLIREIRAEKPDALIFVSGVNWGYDLIGFPLPSKTGVVYSTHVYRNKGRGWDKAFGDLSREAPVFAAEWGGGHRDVKWGLRLARYLEEKGIGWTAWGWPDNPPLIGERYQPTAFGQLVRTSLRQERTQKSTSARSPR